MPLAIGRLDRCGPCAGVHARAVRVRLLRCWPDLGEARDSARLRVQILLRVDDDELLGSMRMTGRRFNARPCWRWQAVGAHLVENLVADCAMYRGDRGNMVRSRRRSAARS